MISDEELKAISEVDVNLIVKNYCLVFKIPQVEAEAAIGPVMRAQEMAQELLAYREAERTIWQNAPEWANWFARDDNGMERFFAEKPLPSEWGWVLPEDAYDSLQSPRLTDNWQTTLQERPK